MPVKNGQAFLKESMVFLMRNCSEQDEILVINDNSTDDSLRILKAWEKTSRNVRVISSPKNGLVNALNLGVLNASNAWIARFDVDDEYPDNRIFETRKFIAENIVCVFSDYRFTTLGGIDLGIMPTAIGSDLTYLSLVTSQRTAHSSVCFNKAAVLDAGGYRNEDFPAEDISLWLRISRMGSFYSIPQVLLDYRISRNSVSGRMREKALAKKDLIVSNFKFDEFALDRCIANLDNTKLLYSRELLGNKRYLLHLRDLYLINTSPLNLNKNLSAFVRKEIIKSLGLYASAGSLLKELMSRKIYRSI